MRMPLPPPAPGKPQVRVPLWGVLLALAACPAPAGPAAAPPPKPYTLFFGADLDIQQGKEFCRVQDVAGDTLVARVDGALRPIPTNAGPVNLRLHQALKLGGTTVTIAKLKAERVYTPGNDPVRKFAREQPGSAGLAQYDIAQGKALESEMNASIGSLSGPLSPQVQAGVQAAEAAADQARTQMNAAVYDPSEYAIRMQNELAKQEFDAIEITFDVSAPTPLPHPYIVIVAQYREPDAPAGAVHNWIYAQALDPIDRAPRAVTINRGGFPKGFELQSYQLHLYDRGRELATSVADRRLPLTRDEAFQYVVLDYFASHKGENVPASPALFQLPADLRTHVSDAQFTQTFYVTVTKNGLPTAAYLDPDCRQKIEDPYLQSVILDIRFTPQLDQGRPIGGVALVKLSHLL
ncbi:MAG TPA: hypothetical protein VMF63_13825 [Opitutaceae bacterium]|nr:hypothetical protein [Opitutaceae bacterium]